MNTKHDFIFKPGTWIGEGKMVFSSSPDEIRYYTKWTVAPEENKQIFIKQMVEMNGVEEHVNNTLNFSTLTNSTFIVKIDNELFGNVIGKGLTDDKSIAWEFRGTSNFEGFEVYELQDNGDYIVHAEYSSADHRTTVDGRIWKKP